MDWSIIPRVTKIKSREKQQLKFAFRTVKPTKMPKNGYFSKFQKTEIPINIEIIRNLHFLCILISD